jgi:transcriptional regulator with XRE-family HTH domain
MGSRDHIREFLTTRRARLTPDQAGLPQFGGRRRVPGLRREEVALLAGMSTEYYVRLERGNATGVSESILEGISRALRLDAAEQSRLRDLAGTANEGANTRRQRKPSRQQQVRQGVQQTIDAMTTVPVIVQNGRLDIVAANKLDRALFGPILETPERQVISRASSSCTRMRMTSTAIGATQPSRSLRCCAVKPVGHPTIALSQT